ncbi:MAG TPA: tetratricopeptide repeat protein [Bacteroides sp.]|nr:tetratricopeptide repeat protein [Bacteroides sp.]
MEKNTSLSRNYHNLTSHYNVYFNGNESYKKGIERAGNAIRNDYTRVLNLFLYEDESVHGAVNADMQRAIDKATKVITFHSITAKPKVKAGDQSPKQKAFFEKKEFNKWVDDSYMLMGKAYMYQGEYFLAVETFKHVLVTFPAEEIRFLALTWLARAYIMTGEMREAERILSSLSTESGFPDDYLKAYHTTWADYYMKTESYQRSAEHLEQALQAKRVSKDEKIRFTYILAQLYEKSGQNELALDRYRRVTRFNPPYEMAFNARVSMAEVYESGSGDSQELKKLLTKMLRDSKNKEYKDQIYFALGNIAFKEGERDKAIEYYQLSVSSSVQNHYQKGFSSLTLAEIFYEQPDYILSAAYYDSAVSFLNRDYPGYNNLTSLSASLGGLVRNVNTFELEDSLQMLAALPEEQRLSIIDGIIEQVKKEEQEAREAEQQAMQDRAYNQSMLYGNNPLGSGGAEQGGAWYFYNLNAKSFGQPEFRMKWGDRTLEDNWRRKNKQTISGTARSEGTAEDTISGEGAPRILDNKSREYYLVNVPLTDSAMEQSHLRLEDALYNMGLIYKDNLLDYRESVSAFEELLTRYPAGRYAASAMYHLHELYNILQQPDMAGTYKARLLSEYPDTHQSKLLNNPNYIRELEEEEQKVVRFYEGVYNRYQQGDYQGVITDATRAIEQYGGDPLVPKFKYIRALAVGAVSGKEEMKTEMDSLIAQHPGVEESERAREIVDYLYETFPVIREAEEARVAEEIYSVYAPEATHYFLIALDGRENLNQVNFDLLNYNLDHFNQYNLEIEKMDFSSAYDLLVVREFNNAAAAGRYLQVIAENSEQILAGIPPSQYRMMIISEENFEILTGQREINPYDLFYKKHYQNPEE